MKQNNRGFTLTELVVAVAILSVVVVGIYGFMIAGSRSYRSISASVSLQTAAQQTVSQIQENALDCNVGVCAANGTALYLMDRSASGVCTIRAYTLDTAQQRFYYQEITNVNIATAPQTVLDAEKHLLSEDVSSFTVQPRTVNAQTDTLTLQMQFRRDEKQYPVTQTVALRNLPAACADLSALIALAE